MRQLGPPSTSHRRRIFSRRRERGAVALLVVFGIFAMLLLFLALLFDRAGRGIQMAAAEEKAFQTRQAIGSRLNELAARADADPAYLSSVAALSAEPCAPTAADPGSSILLCHEILPGRLVTMSRVMGELYDDYAAENWPYASDPDPLSGQYYYQIQPARQYPIRVRWKTEASAPYPLELYAWIIVDPVTDEVVGLWSEHSWCTPDEEYYVYGGGLGFCTGVVS